MTNSHTSAYIATIAVTQMKRKQPKLKQPPTTINISSLESVAESMEYQLNQERIELIRMRNWA